jgi:Uma2 family endonuclease
MAPPLLVVEIVGPGDLQRDRDYIAKRMQYQDRGIPEYWIVDPQLETILKLELVDDVFIEAATFRASDRICSQVAALNLTAAEIFAAGKLGE